MEDRLEQWMEQYTDRLVRFAFTYVRNWATAEDRVQDTFIKAYNKMNLFVSGSDPFPWLAKILLNECKMTYRKSWREVVSEFTSEIIANRFAKESQINTGQNNDVYELVLCLPEPYRTTVVLHYFEELSLEQIAQITGKSVGTVKSRLSRARMRLKRVLEEDGYGTRTQEC